MPSEEYIRRRQRRAQLSAEELRALLDKENAAAYARRKSRTGRARVREWKRRYELRLVTKGLTRRGRSRLPYDTEAIERANAERAARVAFRWYLRSGATPRWVRDYYRPRPWENVRLTRSQKWRIRYRLDGDFHARHYKRMWEAKARRAEKLASVSDGTLTNDAIRELFGAAKDCSYCGLRMQSTQKTLDHVVALAWGGTHSILNVKVCCSTCNSRKATKPLRKFLAELAATNGTHNC